MMNVPGPLDSSFSQLRRLRKDFLGYLQDAALYGDLVLLRPAPGVQIYLVNHPGLIEDILVKRPECFHKSRMTRRLVGKFLGNGLVLSEDEVHDSQRRQLQPAFHGRRLLSNVELIAEITRQHIASWCAGQAIDLDDEMTRLTMQVVVRTMFGVDKNDDAQGVGVAMDQFAQSMASRFRSLPMPDWLPLPRHRRERRAIETLNAAIQKVFEARKSHARDDLISMLLATQEPVEFSQIRDHLATFYFAGHETTAKLLTWTLYLLAQNPEADEKLRKEIDGLEEGSPLTVVALSELQYLDQVLKEALRLYPPAWLFDREPVQDIDLGGYCVPKGSTIYLSPYVMQRDTRWFSEPEKFNPDRFSPTHPVRMPRYAYFPFGFGPRNCIGRGLAELNAKASLVVLLKAFRFASSGQTVELEPGATLRPKHGLKLMLANQGPRASKSPRAIQ